MIVHVPRHTDDYDVDPDEADDDERDDPLPEDMDDPDDDDEDGDDETVPCPFCKKPVFEGAELCPHCRSFVSSEDAPRRHGWLIWVGVILALIGMLWWVF